MKKIIIAVIVLLLISLPYVYAATSAGDGVVFGGFLLNPKDGNSYLAKMYQGYEGGWLFRLPFNPEAGNPQPLFTFYLFLGHLARILQIPLIWVFHLARLGAAGFLLWMLGKLSAALFPGSSKKADSFFFLAALGSGMGWLLFVFGVTTSDLWVAEAYPFLSMYVNPHFPLGLGLMIWMLLLSGSGFEWKRFLAAAAIGVALSVVLPFGIVLVGLVLGIAWLWKMKRELGFSVPWDVLAVIPGGVWAAVQYLVTIRDPMLKIWNQQNITPAPVIWDWIISFSPALIMLFVALNKAKEPGESDLWNQMLIWAAAATIFQVVPFSLQRRFLTGFYLPLAAYAIRAVFLLKPKPRKWLLPAIFFLSIPTNIVVLFLGFYATEIQAEDLFIGAGENQAYEWVRQNTAEDAVILSGARAGGRIPGQSGCRVVYGHEFETVHAAEKLEGVERYFLDPFSPENQEWAAQNGVDYVWVGRPERQMMPGQPDELGREVFSNPDVTIYQLIRP